MSVLLVILFICLACRVAPDLLAELIATVVGAMRVITNRRTSARLLRLAHPVGTSTWQDKPSRAEFKVLRNGLAAALNLTEFTSLLPMVSIRVHKFIRI